MAINIVIGPSWSGKYEFIIKNFPEHEILSVGVLQREMLDENPDGDFLGIIVKAHEQIIEEFIQRLTEKKDVVMAHTLYKPKRRIAYIEKIREVSDEPIDIYVMQPSDEQILDYIEADKERSGSLEQVKFGLRQLEIPTKEEGFAHVYMVNEKGIQDWTDKPHEIKIINSSTNITRKEYKEKRHTSSINGFGKQPFKHLCEVCGKVKVMTSKEAYDEGWDYPGEDGIYKSMPGFGFGIMSPRTCEKCGMEETAYWALVAEKKSIEQLDERKKQAIERIVQEPNILKV